ncbi:unnamed protein product [Trichobilharzia regenti]|nr:unnamed protein product [Trichobilharzia regenti]
MTTGTIWYMRQKLEKMGIIKSQVGKKPVTPGLLLHHRKYYTHFPFPPAMFMDRISQFLLNKPKHKCFGFEIRKSDVDVDDDDMLNILQQTGCAVDPHHRYPCMVNLVSLKKPFSMDSWISECGQGENAFGFKKCKKEEYDIDSDDALDDDYEGVDDQLELSAVKLENPDGSLLGLKSEENQNTLALCDTLISTNASSYFPVSSKFQCLVYAKRLLACK